MDPRSATVPFEGTDASAASPFSSVDGALAQLAILRERAARLGAEATGEPGAVVAQVLVSVDQRLSEAERLLSYLTHRGSSRQLQARPGHRYRAAVELAWQHLEAAKISLLQISSPNLLRAELPELL